MCALTELYGSALLPCVVVVGMLQESSNLVPDVM